MSSTSTGSSFERERPVPLIYKGVALKAKFYIDFVVENQVIVELKSVAEVAQVHECQVLTQLKLTGPCRLPVWLTDQACNVSALLGRMACTRLVRTTTP